MQPAAAGVPTNYLSLFLGGQYYGAYQEDYDASVPWANRKPASWCARR